MKKILVFLLLLCTPAIAQNYLRDDGTFHSVVEGTTTNQLLSNVAGNLGGVTIGAGLVLSGAGGTLTAPGPMITIASQGAVCNGSTDDTVAIQAAWTAAAAAGTDVWLGSVGTGVCKFSTLTQPTPTGTGRSSFLKGPGASITKLLSTVTGTTCAVNVSTTYGVNSYLTGSFSGFTIEQLNQSQGGYGVCLTGVTQLTFEDVRWNYFARGISAADTITLNIQDSLFFRNNVGAYGAQVSSSPPNAWTFLRTGFTHNFQNAILLSGPNQLNVVLGRFESNGLDGSEVAVSGATTIDINGPPGGPVVGANIEGNYFEGNSGLEVTLRQSGLADKVGAYNIRGNTFTRTLLTQTGAVSIINNGTGTSQTTVNVGGNSFYDSLNNVAGFAWLSAQTPATTNYLFNCIVGNRIDVAAEMPAFCRQPAAGTVPLADSSGQYIGYVAINTAGGAVVPTAALTANGVVYGGGSGVTPATTAAGTNGQLFLGVTGAAPNWGTMSGDATVTNAGALTIANNAVTLAKLATQATNTVLGNATAGTAVPTALTVGSCSTAASALIWTTNTGFGCNTAITAATNANLTGPITSVGNATSIASQTGTGTKFVVDASPTLTGTPLSTTAAADTNTTQIATTAFVLGQVSVTTPLLATTAGAVGGSAKYARADHQHPANNTYSQLLFGTGNLNAIAQNSTWFFTTAENVSTENVVAVPMSQAGTIDKMYCSTNAAPGGSAQTFTNTMRKNASDQTVTCAMTTGGAATCNDTTHSFSVVAGDLIAVKLVTSATSGSATGMNCGVRLTTTSP